MMPVTMSPSRPAYSSYFISRSASRMRWLITWRAVWAAMRPKSSGVTSNSSPCGSPPPPRPLAVLVQLLGHHPDLARVGVDGHPRVLVGTGHAAVGGLERIGQSTEQRVDR